jgi:hypothetical protein
MIIDHSTTTAEAASHTGGKRGRGGDILYRWGNPENYGRGIATDRKLFQQHDAKWIDVGLPRAGDILVFNNGIDRVGPKYSTVEIVKPPLLPDSSYDILASQPYGPATSNWSYPAQADTTFYSATMGGASMQPNGNVLICEATLGEFIEVDSSGNATWEYVSPLHPTGVMTQGATGNNGVFKISRYAPDYPGLAGQALLPGLPVEANPLPYGCTIYTVDQVEELQTRARTELKVFPNPVNDVLTVSIYGAIGNNPTLSVRDVTGKLVTVASVMNSEATIDMSGLAQGLYLVRYSDSNNIRTVKVNKQ